MLQQIPLIACVCFAAVMLVWGTLPVHAAAAGPTPVAATTQPSHGPLYELRIYSIATGKRDALNKRFREHTLRLFEKHGIKCLGFWMGEDQQAGQEKLYYIVWYPDRESRDRMLVHGIAEDPEFLAAAAESEKDGKLTTAIESVLLSQTDYSPTAKASPAPFDASAFPAPVLIYLAAEKAKNPDLLPFCFADNALVHDEGKDYSGIDAIKTWKRAAEAKYRYVMAPQSATVTDRLVTLRARLTGDFPGNVADLTFAFTLDNGRITALRIGQ